MLPEQVTKRIPSLSAAWVRDRQIRWQHAVGTVDTRRGGEPATPDTRYRIGSTTKTFVAVLVMRLVAKGRLGLDDPLGRHLPGTPIGQVTIAQLLSQSSGLRTETDEPWWERTPGIPLPRPGRAAVNSLQPARTFPNGQVTTDRLARRGAQLRELLSAHHPLPAQRTENPSLSCRWHHDHFRGLLTESVDC